MSLAVNYKKSLWLIELARVDWSRLRDVRAFLEEPVVSAEYVPDAVRGLLTAETEEEAKGHYWRLENHVVVQGQTYEAAEYLVPVLVASLADSLSILVRQLVLELIFQTVAYSPHQEEVKLGNGHLTEICQAKAREALWNFYKLFLETHGDESETIRLILEKIETDSERLDAFIREKESSQRHTQ